MGKGKIALRTYHDTYVQANTSGGIEQSKAYPKGKKLEFDEISYKSEITELAVAFPPAPMPPLHN